MPRSAAGSTGCRRARRPARARSADPASPRRTAPGGGSRPAPRSRQAPDEVEEKLGQLKTRLAVAEHSLAADVSDDWATFAAAVEAELRSWDTYLERLQTSVAAKAWKAREQAEAAIGDVRSRRIAVDERLAQARDTVGGAWQRAEEARHARPATSSNRRPPNCRRS